MNPFLLNLLIISAVCSGVIFVLLIVRRLVGKKTGAWWRSVIWIMICVRMLIPWFITSGVDLFSARGIGTIVGTVRHDTEIQYNDISDTYNQVPINDIKNNKDTLVTNENPQNQVSKSNMKKTTMWIKIVHCVYVFGLLTFSIFLLVRMMILQTSLSRLGKCHDRSILDIFNKVKCSMGIRRNIDIRIDNNTIVPSLAGVFFPKIIVPQKSIQEMTYEQLEFVFIHELTHYKRKDILKFWLVEFTLCVHWFNPILYMVHSIIRQDIEIACDEKILMHIDEKSYFEYSKVLMISSTKKYYRLPGAITANMAGKSGRGLKERLIMINNFNKKKIIISGTILLLCCMVVLVSCTTFVSNKKNTPEVTHNITDSPAPESSPEPTAKAPINIFDTDTWQSLIKSDWFSSDIGLGCILKFVKNDSVAGCNLYLRGSGVLVVRKYEFPYVKIDNEGEIFVQLPKDLDKGPFKKDSNSENKEYKLVLEGDTLYLNDVVFTRANNTLIEDENGYRLEPNNDIEASTSTTTNSHDTDTWQILIKSDWVSSDIGIGCIIKFVENDGVAGCNIYLNGSGVLVIRKYESPYVKIENEGEIFVQLPKDLDKAPFGIDNDSEKDEYKLVLKGDMLYLNDVVFRRSTRTLIDDEDGYRLEKNYDVEEVVEPINAVQCMEKAIAEVGLELNCDVIAPQAIPDYKLKPFLIDYNINKECSDYKRMKFVGDDPNESIITVREYGYDGTEQKKLAKQNAINIARSWYEDVYGEKGKEFTKYIREAYPNTGKTVGKEQKASGFRVSFSYMIYGVRVMGNFASCYVDVDGVADSMMRWNDFEKIMILDEIQLNYMDFAKILKTSRNERKRNGKSASKIITSVELIYSNNIMGGNYRPTWMIYFDDGYRQFIDCYRGKYIIEELSRS